MAMVKKQEKHRGGLREFFDDPLLRRTKAKGRNFTSKVLSSSWGKIATTV